MQWTKLAAALIAAAAWLATVAMLGERAMLALVIALVAAILYQLAKGMNE